MITLPPVETNPDLVLFVGQVVQHLPPQPVPGVSRPSPSIVVQVTTPGTGLDREAMVEAIPLGVDPACEPIPLDAADLSERYPTGAHVSVVGRFLRSGAPQLDARGRIVVWPSDLGGLGRVPDEVDRIPAGCLNFEAFRCTYEENPYATWSRDVAWRNTQRGWFEDYEFLSCLTTIDTLVSPSELEIALRNMAFYSRYEGVNQEVARGLYSSLVKRTHLARPARGRLRQHFAGIHDAR